MNPVTEPWCKKADVAHRLGVSVRTVERLKLPHMRVGGQNRYRMSEVYAALNGVPERSDNVVPLRPKMRGAAA